MELLGGEVGLGAEHAVDGMQDFPHDGDVGLQGPLAARDELVEEGFRVHSAALRFDENLTWQSSQ